MSFVCSVWQKRKINMTCRFCKNSIGICEIDKIFHLKNFHENVALPFLAKDCCLKCNLKFFTKSHYTRYLIYSQVSLLNIEKMKQFLEILFQYDHNCPLCFKNCDLISTCETNLSPTSKDVNLDELDSKLEWLSQKNRTNRQSPT